MEAYNGLVMGALQQVLSGYGPAGVAAIWSLISSVNAGPNSATCTTGAIDTTGANLLVAVITGLGTNPVVTDSKSNTWITVTAATGPGTLSTQIVYVKNPTVGSGHTFTFTVAGAGYPSGCVGAFHGADTSQNIDQHAQNNVLAVATTAQAGSITPSVNNELIIFGTGWLNVTYDSVDSGCTIIQKVTPGAGNTSAGLAWTQQTTAAAINPTASFTGVYYEKMAVIGSFKSP